MTKSERIGTYELTVGRGDHGWQVRAGRLVLSQHASEAEARVAMDIEKRASSHHALYLDTRVNREGS